MKACLDGFRNASDMFFFTSRHEKRRHVCVCGVYINPRKRRWNAQSLSDSHPAPKSFYKVSVLKNLLPCPHISITAKFNYVQSPERTDVKINKNKFDMHRGLTFFFIRTCLFGFSGIYPSMQFSSPRERANRKSACFPGWKITELVKFVTSNTPRKTEKYIND